MKERVPVRINLKHLHYFHEVAREGSPTGAARRLHLALQTLSSQVRELGQSLGRTLLERSGRRLVLRLGVTDSVPKLLAARAGATDRAPPRRSSGCNASVAYRR